MLYIVMAQLVFATASIEIWLWPRIGTEITRSKFNWISISDITILIRFPRQISTIFLLPYQNCSQDIFWLFPTFIKKNLNISNSMTCWSTWSFHYILIFTISNHYQKKKILWIFPTAWHDEARGHFITYIDTYKGAQ